MSKGIMMLSGGLDSSLALIKLLEERHTVVPIFANYGQWSVHEERKASFQIVQLCSDKFGASVESLEELKLEVFQNMEDEGVGSVWGRGIALVGLAAMYAYTHGDDFDFVALGNHKGDVGPDCKPGLFDQALGQTLLLATKGRMELLLPIRDLVMEDIGIELSQRNIPFENLYSCYWDLPCGYKTVNDTYRCPGCRRKTIAMKAAGITDKNILDFPNGNGEGRSYQSTKAEKVDY